MFGYNSHTVKLLAFICTELSLYTDFGYQQHKYTNNKTGPIKYNIKPI